MIPIGPPPGTHQKVDVKPPRERRRRVRLLFFVCFLFFFAVVENFDFVDSILSPLRKPPAGEMQFGKLP